MQCKHWVLSLLLVLAAVSLAWAAETMSVQVKQGRLYAGPNFLSKLQATVPYGSRLQVVGEQGAWRQVSTASGQQGWIHISALTEKEIYLQAGGQRAQGGATSEEMTLAGKGFSQEVEKSYRASHQGLNYAAVDQMARAYPVSPAQMDAFIKTGGLRLQEGGGQ
jgi:uncharacterized protein YgiM (DUF1202 family)